MLLPHTSAQFTAKAKFWFEACFWFQQVSHLCKRRDPCLSQQPPTPKSGTADRGLQSLFTPESNSTHLGSSTGQLLPEPLERILFSILCHADVTLFSSTELVHFKQLIHFLKKSAIIIGLQANAFGNKSFHLCALGNRKEPSDLIPVMAVFITALLNCLW